MTVSSVRRGSEVTFSTRMGVTDVQVTGATLPVGVPDVPGLAEPGGNGVPVRTPRARPGLPLGASGLPVTEDRRSWRWPDPLGAPAWAWPPPLCSMLQPPRASVVINSPGMINAVARADASSAATSWSA